MSESESHPPACKPCQLPGQQNIQEAVRVCRLLHETGHEALLVGGCVRDLILGRPLEDIDIATSAHPDQVQILFPKSHAVGKAFGVILVSQGGYQFEVATFRIDSKSSDGRRPNRVLFANAKEDAFRRDFTINSLFYDVQHHQVLDFTGGLTDLKERRIRTVGAPADRFTEDYLRMLRALRFTHTLGFTLDSEARNFILHNSCLINHLPIERIHQELHLLFSKTTSPGAALGDLMDLGIWTLVLHPITSMNTASTSMESSTLKSIIGVLDKSVSADYWEVLAYFAYRQNLPNQTFDTQTVQKLGFSGESASKCVELFRHLTPFKDLQQLDNYQLCTLANTKTFSCLLKFLRAEMEGRLWEKGLKELRHLENRARSYIPAPAPWIRGKDLIHEHIPEGPKRNKFLQTAYRLQLNGVLTDRKNALDWLHQKAEAES